MTPVSIGKLELLMELCSISPNGHSIPSLHKHFHLQLTQSCQRLKNKHPVTHMF